MKSWSILSVLIVHLNESNVKCACKCVRSTIAKTNGFLVWPLELDLNLVSSFRIWINDLYH